MKRRRLGDLYVLGKEVVINDGLGESVEVWIAKLNDVDRESLLRRSSAAKARFLMEGRDEQSETYQATWAQVVGFDDREGLISVVIADDVVKYRIRVEAEVSADEETWGKEGYLQGLVDSWLGDPDNPGLVVTHIEAPDDPEVVRVMSELERYNDEVMKRVNDEADRLQGDWEHVSEEELWAKAAHKLIDRRAEEVFSKEYERQELFYSVREPDLHHVRYFATVSEIDDLDERIREQLLRVYNELVVDAIEGKDSPATTGSSNSSESPDAATTADPSGPEDASASKTSPGT